MSWTKNQELQLHITDLTSEGAGIGKIDGYPFFVKGAIPGDIIRAGVTKVKKTYGYARLIEVLTPSADRVTPPCPEAHRCGGCQLQHMSYEAQLQFKQKKVCDALTRIGGFEVESESAGTGTLTHFSAGSEQSTSLNEKRVSVPVPLTHSSPTTRYRNKIQVPFGTDRDGNMVYGFYAGRTHAIVPMDDCIAGFPEAAEILKSIRDDCVAHDIPAYDETTGEGILRHVLLRKAFATGEIQVCLVVNCEPAGESAGTGTLTHFSAGSEQPTLLNEKRVSVPVPLTHQILVTFGPVPFVASLSLNHNPARTNVILGPETVTIYGKPYIEDILCGLTFRIAAPSFYQVNPAVTELLYEKVVECVNGAAKGTGAMAGSPIIIWDLYCGIGSISLVLAHRLRAAHVHGVEVVPEAIDNARENARINGIDNATFYVGKAEDIAPTLPRPDVIVVDPPRKGCDAALLQTILGARPKRIVYVSCDPATLARDLKILTADGSYCLTTVRPFDMFPMTYHVECVTLLQRMSNTRERTITLDVEMEDYHRIKNRTEVTADATE